MATSSSQHGAARAPPPPDQLAAFYKVVDKKTIATALFRYARDAELSASAAVHAEALFGESSLVVADLRIHESRSLVNLAIDASGAEREALFRRAWAVLLSVIPLLLHRVEANTLLPGTVKEEEMDFAAYVQAAALSTAQNAPPAPPAMRKVYASSMGYNTLLLAMVSSLNLLPGPIFPAVQKRSVESFVLQGLDVIPRTAGVQVAMLAGELHLVAFIEKRNSSQKYDPTFWAAVLCKWRSDAVSGVLRARGLQTGIADAGRIHAEFETLQRADVAKHGLRDCALPSCSKTEKSIKEFAGCSGCRSVVYCCLEHQALDWRAHKRACREKEAARLAEEREFDDEAGTGGAAA